MPRQAKNVTSRESRKEGQEGSVLVGKHGGFYTCPVASSFDLVPVSSSGAGSSTGASSAVDHAENWALWA